MYFFGKGVNVIGLKKESLIVIRPQICSLRPLIMVPKTSHLFKLYAAQKDTKLLFKFVVRISNIIINFSLLEFHAT